MTTRTEVKKESALAVIVTTAVMLVVLIVMAFAFSDDTFLSRDA